MDRRTHPTARLVPLAQFRQNPKTELTQDGVLFVCAAGVRSETAARLAAQCGLQRDLQPDRWHARAGSKRVSALEHEAAVTAAE